MEVDGYRDRLSPPLAPAPGDLHLFDRDLRQPYVPCGTQTPVSVKKQAILCHEEIDDNPSSLHILNESRELASLSTWKPPLQLGIHADFRDPSVSHSAPLPTGL